MTDKGDNDASKASASTTSTSTADADADVVLYRGGCHCGAVSFEFTAPKVLRAVECNCSICSLKGNPYVILPEKNFRLLQGQGSLTEYRFNTMKARHLFCKVCGVQSFYRPRSNPDCVSVLVPAISGGGRGGGRGGEGGGEGGGGGGGGGEEEKLAVVETTKFDGERWEESFAKAKPVPLG